jgi:hypothetical protein
MKTILKLSTTKRIGSDRESANLRSRRSDFQYESLQLL